MNRLQTFTLNDYTSIYHASHLLTSLSQYFPNTQKQFINDNPIPQGFHFIYCNPNSLESNLGFDGYDNYQAPLLSSSSQSNNDKYYKRRMWVSGKLEFYNNILFGKDIKCQESIIKKRIFNKESENSKCFTTIERNFKFQNNDDLLLKETRTLLYLNDEFQKQSQTSKLNNNIEENYDYEYSLIPSEILLWRYSALTFNSHKIHYDLNYCLKYENFNKILVQGPLAITLLLYWFNNIILTKLKTKTNINIKENLKIKTISYKNQYPLFVNEKMILKCSINNDLTISFIILNHKGIKCLTATALLS